MMRSHARVFSSSETVAGETQAEFAAEGFVRRLHEEERSLFDAATFHIVSSPSHSPPGKIKVSDSVTTLCQVPCVCPDGAFRGHLRTNACGANLNREWADSEGYKVPYLAPSSSPSLSRRKISRVKANPVRRHPTGTHLGEIA